METLAIIAYKQPLTRVEVEEVRGVDCAGILQSLLEKKLVTILGRKDVVGRPFLYGTTPKFLEVFGLENLASLPTLEEIEQLKDSNFPLFKKDTE
jgi:segregation and condensation protein B